MSATAAAPVKPWHFHRHLLRLFSGRPASRPGAETWNSLDGWRAVLCLWMVAFHSFFYAGNFVNDDQMDSVGKSPYLLVLNLGFLPVDGFFVLTGFLIAYPLFREEARRAKMLAEANKDRDAASNGDATVTATAATAVSAAPTPASVWRFDLRTFYYRRVTRMLPSYLLAIYFHCGILFPNLVQHSMDLVRSDSFRNFIDRVLPGLTDAPNNCTPGMLWTNLTWTNHIMPFGGCMGWTWTFALQFNFYLFFPLLWKWAHARLAKQSPGSASASGAVRTPSSVVLPWLWSFVVLSVVARCASFLQIRLFDLRHEEGVFMGFFWYSNTATRGAAIVWGVLAAHASVHTGLVGRLRTSASLRLLGWTIVGGVVAAQMFWNKLFADGNMIETPGWSAMRLTQLLGGAESTRTIWAPNVLAYAHHAFFHAFVLVGSPLSSLVFAFLLLVVVNGAGAVGRALQRFLSLPLWFPLSTLSWWVYLVHPALMIRYNAWHLAHLGELDMSVGGVMRNAALHWLLSFSVALVAYVFFEQPMELMLRQGEAVTAATTAAPGPGSPAAVAAAAAGKAVSNGSAGDASKAGPTPVPAPASFFTRLRALIFVYCVLCMVYIVLHHAAMITAVLNLEPKEYVVKASAIPVRHNPLYPDPPKVA